MAEGFVGGSSAYNILTQPPQVTALTLTAGNAKIDGSFRAVDAAYAGLAHDYWIVRQAGRIPDHPYDGIGVVIPNPSNTSTLSFSLTGLINDMQYGVRVFVRGDYGFQTSPTAGGYATPRGGIAIGTLPLKTRIRYGKIYGAPITWIIADKNHPGYPANSTTIITEQIIKIMCFDVKEVRNSNHERAANGNNRYLHSNIRQWLNSSATAGAWYIDQHSADAPPSIGNVNNRTNPYDTVAGFLNGFTENERTALFLTTHTVGKNSVDGAGTETCTDQIFLLSCTEVGLTGDHVCGSRLAVFNDNANCIATATAQCAANDNNPTKPEANMAWGWWLADSDVKNSSYCKFITKEGGVNRSNVFSNGGLRSACNLPTNLLLSPTPNPDGSYSPLVA